MSVRSVAPELGTSCPTAQASVAEKAATAERTSVTPIFGTETCDQDEPSQCRTRAVCRAYPTAHASELDVAATPSSDLSPEPSGGSDAVCHVWVQSKGRAAA